MTRCGRMPPCHADGQAFAGVLVHHGQALDLPAIGGGVEDEVVGPHHVHLERRMGAGPPRLRERFWGSKSPALAPDSVRARPTQLKAFATKEDADAPIAVTRVLHRQRLHRLDHRGVLGGQPQLITESRSGNTDQPASPTLRQPPLASQLDLYTPACGLTTFLN